MTATEGVLRPARRESGVVKTGGWAPAGERDSRAQHAGQPHAGRWGGRHCSLPFRTPLPGSSRPMAGSLAAPVPPETSSHHTSSRNPACAARAAASCHAEGERSRREGRNQRVRGSAAVRGPPLVAPPPSSGNGGRNGGGGGARSPAWARSRTNAARRAPNPGSMAATSPACRALNRFRKKQEKEPALAQTSRNRLPVEEDGLGVLAEDLAGGRQPKGAARPRRARRGRRHVAGSVCT